MDDRTLIRKAKSLAYLKQFGNSFEILDKVENKKAISFVKKQIEALL
jgi:hypothetical protein